MKTIKNIKKVLIIVLTIVFIVPSSVYAVESDGVSVILDDKIINYNNDYGMPYINENNRTMVPLRLTLESYGAEVEWDGKARVVIITKGDIVVHVPIEKKFIYKNGEKIENDTYAVIVNHRTYLPIRAVMEAFGCEVSWDNENRVVIIKSNEKDEKNIPIKFDLREEGNITAVKDQKNLGTCWAFAALGSIESVLLKQTGYIYDFSEDNVSLKHGYNLTQDEGGDFMLALAYFARWSGPILESDDIYGDGISTKEVSSVKHLQEAFFIPPDNIDVLKKTIQSYGGVHTSIYWEYSDIENDKYYNKDTYSMYYNGDKKTNHDVVIVGWDDNFPKENFNIQPEGNGAFICKNSFGTEFGEEGYLYISYYDSCIGKQNMVYSKIEEKDNYDKIYQSDWLGFVGKIGFETDSGYFANIYNTSDKAEKLSAVSFYTTGINSKYEIYIVDNFTAKEDLKNKVFLESGFIEYSGYYTVKLKEAINIKKNNKFAVIIKITTPGAKYPIAAEFDRDVEWLDKVDLTDGEGYVSINGDEWQNTEESLSSNVCLKAFTNIIEESKELKNQSDGNQDDKKLEQEKQPTDQTNESTNQLEKPTDQSKNDNDLSNQEELDKLNKPTEFIDINGKIIAVIY
ncbi:MAG: lectin like domain-containing protein [Vallitalea sp.]|nr:lectin like domain-containing protein [Vallitalea sp.]